VPRRLPTATLALICASVLSATSHGASLIKASAGLEVTHGFDKPTRDLIARMPEKFREETVKLLKEALPLVDSSVLKYLERVNEIVDTQIDHAACAMSATAANVGTMFKHAIVGGRPQIVASIEEDWDVLGRSFKSNTTPKQYMTRYADFLVNATVTSCQVATTPEARELVDRVRRAARRRWSLWARLEGVCNTAASCLANHITGTTQLVESSDARDLNAVDAKVRLASLTPVPQASLFSSFTPNAYEERLSALLAISDAVTLARLARESVAGQSLEKAKISIQQNEKLLADASRSLDQRQASKNRAALQLAATAGKSDDEIGETTRLAAELVTTLKPETDRLLRKHEANTLKREQIAKTANAYLEQIQTRRIMDRIDDMRRPR
jgi:hypothetical protein